MSPVEMTPRALPAGKNSYMYFHKLKPLKFTISNIKIIEDSPIKNIELERYFLKLINKKIIDKTKNKNIKIANPLL